MIKANYFVNAIRSMGLQAIMNAKQGHPGMTISAAPITYATYVAGINIATENPKWINRDRFVLSGGHGSMSLYPILHFSRLIELDQIKNFRQKISGMPGHPENISNPYIEASTGPLGQGLANAVGMAIAEAYLSEQYKELPGLIDHHTFAIVGDGDLQEGISYEVMSLAGKLNLHKLIVLHDSNKFQLESSVDKVNIENIEERVKSMNWNFVSCTNDPYSIIKAIKNAKKPHKDNKPTFIQVSTIIGEGISVANSFNAHGTSVSAEDLKMFNEHFECNFDNWNFDGNIYYHFYQNVVKKGNDKYKKWQELLEEYKKSKPEIVEQFIKQTNNEFVDLNTIVNSSDLPKDKATRVVAGTIMKKITEANIKDIFVMSPDISKSTNIAVSDKYFNDDKSSNMLLVGIREFGMMAMQNGMQLHGGLRVISSSFLAFCDYLKSALRLAAISHINPLIIFTHDSIAVGSDGPTHQPIEQVGTLRSIPNLQVYRPCDETEVLAAMFDSLNKVNTYPTSIVLSRQNLKSYSTTNIENTIKLGGYPIYNETLSEPDFVICASGSEVELAIKTSELLDKEFSFSTKVFSVPNLNKFLTNENLDSKLKARYGVVSLEASNDTMWYKLATLINTHFLSVNINKFGYSIEGNENYEYLGFNPISVAAKILNAFLIDNKVVIDKINDLEINKKETLKKVEG